MPFLRAYGVLTVTGTTAIRIPMIKRGVVDFAVGADWTPAAGDVKIAINGTAPANVANLPTAVASGNGAFWEFILTAAELTCKQAVVIVSDSATKAVEDQSFIVETFGNASAMYVSDLAAANVPQTGDNFARIGAAGAGLTALGDARIANLDAAISTRTKPADTQARVTLVDTVTAYTGNTPQTGDAYARLGVAGVGLTNLGDARIANLDAAVTTRTKPADTQAAVTVVGTTLALTTNNDKSGYGLSAAAVTAVWNEVLDGVFTARQLMRGYASVLLGMVSGMATATGLFRDISNTKNRVTVTQDANGNRSAITLDLT